MRATRFQSNQTTFFWHVPHAIMLLSLAWPWGIPHATLFVAYSAAVASTYLALALRLIEGAPFSSQLDPTRGATMLPMMILCGIAMAITVGVQYVLVFRSPAIVAASTVGIGAAAFWLTRWSLSAFAANIRWRLEVLSAEIGSVYKEVDV